MNSFTSLIDYFKRYLSVGIPTCSDPILRAWTDSNQSVAPVVASSAVLPLVTAMPTSIPLPVPISSFLERQFSDNALLLKMLQDVKTILPYVATGPD